MFGNEKRTEGDERMEQERKRERDVRSLQELTGWTGGSFSCRRAISTDTG